MDQRRQVRRQGYGLFFVGILLIGANLRAALTPVGPVLPFIQADLELSAAASSVLVSLPLVAFAAVSPVAPTVATRLGMERSLTGSLALLTLGIVVRSVPWEPGIWVGTVALGVAIAILNVVLPAFVKQQYPDDVGRVTGLYFSVQSAIAATAAGFAVPLAGAEVSGWRTSLGVWAGLGVIACAVVLPQLHRSQPPGPGGTPSFGSATGTYRPPWRTAIGWYVTLHMGAQSTVFYVLITWWPSIGQANGFSAEQAGWHLFALQLACIVGNLLAGILTRRFSGQHWLAAVAAVLALVAVGGQLLLPGATLVWHIGYGVSGGAAIVLSLTMFGLRTEHPLQAVRLSGMAQGVGYLLAATGPVLIGLLFEATGSWTWPLLALLGIALVQLVAGWHGGRDRVIGAEVTPSSGTTSVVATGRR